MITETMIYFVGIPAMIAYLLLMLAYADKRKNGDKVIKFPLREAVIATLALDFSVMIPLLFESLPLGLFNGSLNLLSVTIILFCFHVSMLFYSRKFEELIARNSSSSYKKRLMELVLPIYAGLLCLMTNGVSIEAVLALKGGF